MQDDSVELEELPDYLVMAVLATEDRRFFDHFGIDVFGTVRAIRENARAGGVVQGGSSITQQLAKNLFLSNERTLQRKIKEAYLALWLEANLTKREILKLYIDRAYMGGGNFGIGAAAEFYFGKKVPDLDLAESAMLAGLFKAPTRYAPHINLPAARARANEVLTNMVQAGFMTEGQVVGAAPPSRRRHRALAQPLARLLPRLGLRGGEEARRLAPTRCWSPARPSTCGCRGPPRRRSNRRCAEFGRSLQRQAGRDRLDGAGRQRARHGGRARLRRLQFNRAVNALRQPGSSFKPYAYAVALETRTTRPTAWCSTRRSASATGRRRITGAPTRAA